MADDASEIERALRLMEPKEPKELKDSSGSDGYVEGGGTTAAGRHAFRNGHKAACWLSLIDESG